MRRVIHMIVKTPKTRMSIYGFLVSSPLSLPFFFTLVFSIFVLFLGNKNNDRRDLFLPFSYRETYTMGERK